MKAAKPLKFAGMSGGAIVAALFVLALVLPVATVAPAGNGVGIGYTGIVTVEARHPDGTVFFKETNHNLFVDEGKEFAEDQLLATSGIGSNGANYIAVSNDSSSPTAGETTCDTEITANGFARAQGTVNDVGTGSNTVIKTFTATGSQSVQKTCLFTDVTSGEPDTLLAMNTFTQVTLATDDQLTVNWTVTLS